MTTDDLVALRPVTPMGILAQRLDDLCGRLDGVDGVDARLQDELRQVRDLAVGLDPYVEEHTTGESPALARLAQRTRSADWAGTLEAEMLSGHVEGQFLSFLVRATRARRVLEVGMFTGYSALAMAEALPEDGHLVACEVDQRAAAIAREAFDASPAGASIEVLVGPASESLRALSIVGEQFDLVFVDADKAGYADYLDALLDRDLLAEGAVVCVDNTLLQGEPWASVSPTTNGAAIAAFNARVAADDRLEQVLLPLRDGVTLIRRVG
ncbi:MAG: class I SAM-dependent methyltransferase [Nocardioidaceae bacterium]|nr:class I SAM-dependent methyltransferase [Nocardioidaceae bacterium]